MAAIFSDRTERPSPPSARKAEAAVPRPAVTFLEDEDSDLPPLDDAPRSVGVRFDAQLDVCELDDRGRPGLTWTAQARELSRSHIAFRSRRMCYVGRRILMAVHLIDDRPVPLCGHVSHCMYDGEGMYRVEIELARVPNRADITAWLAERRPR